MTARTALINAWLDYWNNYLTPETYADHHHMTTQQAKDYLAVARSVYESVNPHE